MESTEERALRELRLEFIRRLDVDDYVLDFLQQEGALSDLACEQIKAKECRAKQAEALIDCVVKKSIIPMFIEGLRCRNGHPYLANLLTDKIRTLTTVTESEVNISMTGDSGQSFDYSFGSSFSAMGRSVDLCSGREKSSTDLKPRHLDDPDDTCVLKVCPVTVQKDCAFSDSESCPVRSAANLYSICASNDQFSFEDENTNRAKAAVEEVTEFCVSKGHGGEDAEDDETKEVIHQPPRKVDIMDRKKKVLTKIHYHLKLLSHDGKKVEFDDFISRNKERYSLDADIMFTLLDAEVESRRLVYDTGLYKGSIFDDMQMCITSSSHPIANTMTFLARKGSARTMKESLEVGLDMLEEARSLSEHIQPCKDTGMVLYILINVLFQVYETNPTLATKDTIIRKIDEAINVHFAEGPSFLREDYTRMLYLKMVFCYLGIGLFGNTIEDCTVSETDLKSAETCLQIIDSSQAKFDSRREMFYFMAKSVLYRKRGKHADALKNAKLAKWKAKRCKFNKELGPILELTGDLEEEIAEKDLLETKARESEIERDLLMLESENVLVRRILNKPAHQWGETGVTSNDTPQKGANTQELHGILEKLLFLGVMLLAAATLFVLWKMFFK